MKTKLKPLTIMVWLFFTMLQLHAQGYIVPNGVSYAGNVPGLGSEIHVLQNPTNSDYTGFFLTPQGKTQPTVYTNTFSFNPFLDEGVRTFLVSSNDSISLQPILSQNYTELGNAADYVFNSGSPFYLGFYTGYNPFTTNGTYTGIYSDPLFGWARMVNNQGAIQLLDSALVYNAEGIYAGTFNIIPEPSSFAIGILGAALLGMCRHSSASLARLD